MKSNTTLYVISQLMGYTQMIFWIIGLSSMLYEPMRVKSSSSLSKDFIFIQLIGCTLLVFQDTWGFFSPKSSYAHEVHCSDILLSFICVNSATMAEVLLHTLPEDTKSINNKYTLMSIVPNSLSILLMIYMLFLKDLDSAAIMAGSLKGFLTMVAYIPQILLIFRNKSTKGYSMIYVSMDYLGCILAIAQIIIDYYNQGSEGVGFMQQLNWGKFSLNFFGIISDSVMLYQHYFLYHVQNESLNRKEIDVSEFELIEMK